MLPLVFKSMLKEREKTCFFSIPTKLSNTQPISFLLFNQMKPYSFLLPIILYVHLHLLLLFMCFGPNRTIALQIGNQTDHFALLKFKESISSDPNGILDSWNSSTHFCNWHGITCNAMYQRVSKLMLEGYELHGSISPYVGNLSFLTYLNLGNNSFNNNIPQELGSLSLLRLLILPNNSLVGEFPTNLTKCSNLKALDLEGNNLTGKLPRQIGSLGKLQILYMERNNILGQIPLSIQNLSSLVILSLSYNNLEGNVPQEICYLKQLNVISVHVNKLSGSFPSCLYNMSSLTVISAAVNHFDGSLPPSMFHTLPNLRYFSVGANQISGTIPSSVANAVNLALFEIKDNHFVGHVPRLGNLQHLWMLNLGSNYLGDNSSRDLDFLESLTNCSKLEMISIAFNRFGGSLPISVGNLSPQLSGLYFGNNQISGKIPTELGNLSDLIILSLEHCRFNGIIPPTFRNFQKMQLLDLSDNNLSGEIPPFIGNINQLFQLNLGGNSFQGNIPSSIGNCQKLQFLDLSRNNFSGTIPPEILSLSSLSNFLDLSQNSLSGNLPKEVGKLTNINWIDVSENHLLGDIPETIGDCVSLENLFLQGNSFQGKIPSQFASLKGLQQLDLSRNQLSGKIPKSLQNISFLEYFNVSFNMLEGEVPTEGVFRNASEFVVTGNTKLCGGISQLRLPPCPVDGMKHAKHYSFRLIVVIVSLVSFLLILAFSLSIYCIRKRKKKLPSHSPTIDLLAKVSYQDLHRGTDGFSTRNLIGSGSYGSVYRGSLVSDDKFIVVKVLNLQKKGAHKSFITECNALKNIRHRNLIKILTCCSSSDYKGQEFKALVFEYMENGSLEQWLHPVKQNIEHPKTLDLDQIINITIDVASALHYLHHECEQLVLHCDLKPSNVLLDDDMVAHVSDFGIAKLVSTIEGTSHKETSSTIGIKGTVGYAPPEYGMDSKVSTSGDMYSFGILMLEMLTGRRPTDEMFKEGRNMHNFVASSFPYNLGQMLNPHLIPRDGKATIEDRNKGNLIPNEEKCLLSLFRIGLACSMESPKERMNIVDVTRELNIIRNVFLSSGII